MRTFARTSVVATAGDELVGFVLGLSVPDEPSTLFVWQIAVAPAGRGRGLGLDLLRWLDDRVQPTHLEATVTPSNTASQRLFAAFARDRGAPLEVRPWASAGEFPEAGHEPEDLHRIGPLRGG